MAEQSWTWHMLVFFFFFLSSFFFFASSDPSPASNSATSPQYSAIRRLLLPLTSSNNLTIANKDDDEELLFVSAGAQPFPLSEKANIPPPPSGLWDPTLLRSPLPTNAPWLNFILNDGSTPEYIHPYLIQSKDGAISMGYPSRIVQPGFIIQSFVPDLTITSSSLSSSSSSSSSFRHVVSHYQDLSVTLQFQESMTVPLVRGCPYITFVFQGDGSTVRMSSIHGVIELWSQEDLTKHRITFNNGQKWLIYSSQPLHLSSDLSVRHDFQGFLRVAYLPSHDGDDGDDDDSAEAILDRFKSSYPVNGYGDLSVPFQVKYSWETEGSGQLLMLSLPMHRDMMSRDLLLESLQELSYNSIDGEMQGIVGDSWDLSENPISIDWYSLNGIVLDSESKKEAITDALGSEVSGLKPITTDSSYFYGKAVARAARMALIAQEMGSREPLQTARKSLEDSVETVRKFLEESLTPWMEGTFEGNAFLYDGVWGGLTTRNGAMDSGADFGFGLYNDHHYHLGYFCYAGAVLAKLDPSWGASYKPHLYALVEDYMSLGGGRQKLFPRLRNFDLWVLHSWAGGLTEFYDGRNQESTSEAVNAYYAASLLGRAFGDDDLIYTALTLAALEMRAARALWHVPSDSTLYESEFVSENRVVGVLWANKRDSGLWFAPAEWRECRLGIQVLPIVPITELLFGDVGFVRELVDWALPALQRAGASDGWKGFVYAMQASYSPQQALANVLTLSEYDDGNSLTNLLWWVFSRA